MARLKQDVASASPVNSSMDAGYKLPRGAEEVRFGHTDDPPAEFYQALNTRDVFRPLGGVGEVVLTLVFEREPGAGKREVNLRDPDVTVEHIEVRQELAQTGTSE